MNSAAIRSAIVQHRVLVSSPVGCRGLVVLVRGLWLGLTRQSGLWGGCQRVSATCARWWKEKAPRPCAMGLRAVAVRYLALNQAVYPYSLTLWPVRLFE